MRKWMKTVVCCGVFTTMFSTLTACGEQIATYTYENEEVSDIQIEKTEVYADKLVLTLDGDGLSDVERVDCYGTDFSVIEEDASFSFEKDKLTIQTEEADRISGLRVEESAYLYFKVRYLDTDAYAMLVYMEADDAGQIVEGDKDAYYTEEEKEQKEAEAKAIEEEQNRIYDKVLGSWIDESETVRLEFSYDEGQGEKWFEVYELVDDEWVEKESTYIAEVEEQEAFESMRITLYDNPSWGCAYDFYISYDNKELECRYSDEKFVRK